MFAKSTFEVDQASIPIEIQNHRLHQQKLDYFLIGAAGASIAFAVQATANEAWSPRMILWLVSVTMWGISIACGIFRQIELDKFYYNSISLLKIERGGGEYLEVPLEERELLRIQVVACLKKMSSRFAKFAKWQRVYLLAGIVFFLVWHVASMIMLNQ